MPIIKHIICIFKNLAYQILLDVIRDKLNNRHVQSYNKRNKYATLSHPVVHMIKWLSYMLHRIIHATYHAEIYNIT